jgi:hypothetical protein
VPAERILRGTWLLSSFVENEAEIGMSVKPFVVAIFASVIALTAEAQEQRANRELVAKPIDKVLPELASGNMEGL